MRQIIMGSVGEIAIKGLNRGSFERVLARNLRIALRYSGKCKVHIFQSRVYIIPEEDGFDIPAAVEVVKKVFGIVVVFVAAEVEKDYDVIKQTARDEAKKNIISMKRRGLTPKTFKVDTKRIDKEFGVHSYDVCCDIGEIILDEHPELTVDVHNPDFVVRVEIREKAAYVFCEKIPGAGGMPVGSNGKACLLISGGIDSPVAGHMIAKRGVELCAVHFYSYPYTSERAKQKVLDLVKLVAGYAGEIKVMVVPYTEIQLQIHQNCDEDYGTILMRRSMMRIAEKLAIQNDCLALVTGESVGQVASQTMSAINCTNSVCTLPVYRPLIGMDKMETVDLARKIGTFETSIQPYEDCCTVFTPKHPKTKPILELVRAEEAHVDFETLEQEAIANVEVININQYSDTSV